MSRKQADLIFSLVLLGIMVWMVVSAAQWDLRARLFPQAIGIPGIALGLLQLGFAVRGLRSAPATAAPMPVERPAEQEHQAQQPAGASAVIADAVEHAFGAGSAVEEDENVEPALAAARFKEMVLWIVIMAIGIVTLGFELGASIVSFLFLRLRAHESIKMSLGIAIGTYIFFYVLFDRFLNIPFPNGFVADVLGLAQPLDHFVMNPIADFIQRR